MSFSVHSSAAPVEKARPVEPGISRARLLVLPAASALLLLSTGLVAFVRQDALFVNAAGLGMAVLAAVAWLVGEARERVRRSSTPSRSRDAMGVAPAWSGPRWGTLEMLLVLSPVLLLTFIFPVAVARISGTQVGGVPLTTVLLASSITVPWLSMAVCLPLYRAIGHLLPVKDITAVRTRFVQVWPVTFLQACPIVLIFAIPLELVMRWSLTAVLTYVGLCLLHAAFAQSLVLVNVSRDRLMWAVAWVGYAAALLLFPAAWFLPPLVGLLTQLVPLRSVLHRFDGSVRLDHRDVAADLGRGVLLGSVLWAHLLFLFLKTQAVFDVTLVFFAVLPAVLAYNYYFVRLAPTFDQGVLIVRSAMENDSQSILAHSSRTLSVTVIKTISRTAFVGAVLSFAVVLVAYHWAQTSVALVGAVALGAWLFLMTTLLCYKLDYIGQSRKAQAFSAAHLVAASAAFLLLPLGVVLYGWLIAAELLIFVAALREAVVQWRTSEYALFWRHATAW